MGEQLLLRGQQRILRGDGILGVFVHRVPCLPRSFCLGCLNFSRGTNSSSEAGSVGATTPRRRHLLGVFLHRVPSLPRCFCLGFPTFYGGGPIPLATPA